jgi:hypothetical protein
MKKLFVFICDSYFDPTDAQEFEAATGLIRRETYDFAGAGGSDIIMCPDETSVRPIDAEHFLLFTGTFHGSMEKAVAYAKQVKEINPNATIYFRSASDESRDPVFVTSIDKDPETLASIVTEFVKHVG